MNKLMTPWMFLLLIVSALWAGLAFGQSTPQKAPEMSLTQQRDQTIYSIGYASRHYDDLMTQAMQERQRIDELRKALTELDAKLAQADQLTSGTIHR